MSVLVDKIENILKSSYNIKKYIELINEIFPKANIVSLNKFNKEFTNFSSHIEGSTYIGNYETIDKKNIIIMSVELKKASYVENSRSTQRSYAKKLIENANADAAFIAFYTEGDTKWRISFVRLDYEIKLEKGSLKTKENLTPAKRYSYLLGENEPCHTAISQFEKFISISELDSNHPTLDDLEDVFSVEKVTDEFFKLYCDKFHQLRESLENNEDFRIEAEHHNFTSAQFAKKLMGQIVFLYFLQKKGWLGVKAWPNTLNEKEYKNAYYSHGAKSRELIPIVYKSEGNGIYRISNAGLNSISDEDEEILAMCVKGNPWGSGPQNFMRKLFNISEKKGQNFFDELLEPLFYDALNVNRGEQGYCPALHCRIPFLSGGLFEPIDGYDWKHNNFAIPNEIFSNASTKGREADGILDIFDRYNFTMSEDEPMEREVAIDPEMLGKVFENLLEVNDRKSKGAFYTPREIVHYMCQESLINYLVTTLQLEEVDVRDFILYGDFMKDEDTVKDKRQGNKEMYISENLYKIDSDGNVVVDRLKDIDKALENVRVADPAVGSGAFPLGMLNEIVRARQNISAYMSITMNSYDIRMMYQLDRSPHKLKYETIKNCIFAADIDPSAVDIAQLRLWLSLVIDDEINPNAKNWMDGHTDPLPLPNLESNIICGNSLIDEFEGIKLIKESDLFGDGEYQVSINQSRYETLVKTLIEKQHELFICNDTNKKKQLKKDIESIKDLIIISQFEGCNDDVVQRYKDSKRLASKPYVLWQLDFVKVFREKGGFDIVIGNPPYVSAATQMLDINLSSFRSNIIESRRYKTLYSKWDLYVPFMELGMLLLKNKGVMSMIVPYPLTNQIYAKKLREMFTYEYNLIEVVDLKETKVFEATVQNCIPFIVKNPPLGSIKISRMLNNKINVIFNQTYEHLIQDKKSLIWNLTEENRGIEKYKDMNILGDFCYVSKGMVLNADEKKAKGEFKKKDLISFEKDNIHCKMYIEGKDIDKYKVKRTRYLEWGTKRCPNELSRPTFEELYTSPKLLFNCLGDLKVAIDTDGKYYCEQAIRVVVPWKYIHGVTNRSISSVLKKFSRINRAESEKLSEQVSLKYILGIVNSKFGSELLTNLRGGDYHIVPEHIRNIPIPLVDISIQNEIESIVDKIISMKEKNIDTSELENKLNYEVEKIYEKDKL